MNAFVIDSFLGKGTYGVVYKVRRKKTGKTLVVKEISTRYMSMKEKQDALNEVRLLASLSCPNIISYVDSFFERASEKLLLVMEYASNGDLQQAIHARKQRRQLYEEAQVWSMFLQVALALKHLHAKKILHRDLKTANIFLCANNVVKLGDLGVSKLLKADDQLAKTSIGTPYYLSPEILKQRSYNDKSDVWALGCVLYELLTFRHPFEGHDMRSLASRVLHGNRQPIDRRYSADMNRVLDALLTRDPSARLSIDDLFKMPEIRSRLHLVKTAETTSSEQGPPELVSSPTQNRTMLGTIRFKKKGLNYVVDLPEANYDDPRLPEPSVAPQPARVHARAALKAPRAAIPMLVPKLGPLPTISESTGSSGAETQSLYSNKSRMSDGGLQPTARPVDPAPRYSKPAKVYVSEPPRRYKPVEPRPSVYRYRAPAKNVQRPAAMRQPVVYAQVDADRIRGKLTGWAT
ncbi:Protein kinase domain [Carpediemonas membranifera]|uniref:non-specific serine/threonine protein kinase n=1 Tax=Carpediemonas membranifera TaxID=201153 RepID=A0A8J6AXM5_9EUKA|nr:Protein kinase domain [Carpediemonas membranifera]|eukprot:KAG9394035.1 Protein kinase domain [Carpediemonas membranifera]